MNHPISQLPLRILVLFWVVLRPERQPQLTTYMEVARYLIFLNTLRAAFPEPDRHTHLQKFAIHQLNAWILCKERELYQLDRSGSLVHGFAPSRQ